MPKLVLVDGSSYLYRAFHALPDLRTTTGEPTGAIRGVISMLRRLVADEKPDYFAVVFDAPGKTFRDDWYPQYKANRTAMPDDLSHQIAPLNEMIRAHGWPLLTIDGIEADDVIGTLVCRASKEGIESLVSTGDKDLAQLVCGQVTLVNTMSNETLDEAGVIGKFGVRADQILDYLTLIGDAIDNVPGVPKVGPKTAAKWLNQYGSLEGVIAHAHEITGMIGENLRATLDWLPQGKRLLRVKTDCPLPVAPKALVPAPIDLETLEALYERFEFRAWRKELGSGGDDAARAGATAQAASEASAPTTAESGETARPQREPRQYVTLTERDAFAAWLDKMRRADVVCLDTETTSRDPMRADLVGLAFAFEPHCAVYIPLTHRYAGVPSQLAIDWVLGELKPWFEDPSRLKLAQNAKYDEHVLANHGIALAGLVHDIVLQSYVLESHKPHDMESLALRFLDEKTTTYAEVAGKGASQIGFDQVALDRATEYAAEDADVTLRLHRELFGRIAVDDKLTFVYQQIELPTREVLVKMERNGVLIDAAQLNAEARSLGTRVSRLEERAFEIVGAPFNLGSPKQLGEILFERMGLPVVKKTASGQPSTDEEVLQALSADYPLPKLLLEHRALSKLKSTYADKLPQMVNPQSGRVHTTYSQSTAVTGRLSSNDPNLQNIPVRSADGRRIRESFVAPPGHVIVSADYSQIELRIMAHLSGDKRLLEAFAQGADIHRATAGEIFNVPMGEVTADQRRYIKAVNFGLIYGMSAFGLAAQLSIERAAAQAFIDRYFTRYPGVADYMQRTREAARAHGFVETVFGRRLWLSDIRAGGGPRRQAAERAAINAPMQGTAADLIKLAMIAVQAWLERERLESKLVMQVHDELVLEVPEAELGEIQVRLPELMTQMATLSVPLVVDVGSGPNWEQAH